MNRSKDAGRHRIIIIVLLLIVIMLLALICEQCGNHPVSGSTAVIEHNDEVALTNPDNGSIRIKINPAINVKGDVMQNLNFCNYNEGRLLRCRILFEEEYIYDSGLVASGDILKGDYIRTELLSSGNNEAIAEIYSYDDAENLMGQTNVKIILNNEG